MSLKLRTKSTYQKFFHRPNRLSSSTSGDVARVRNWTRNSHPRGVLTGSLYAGFRPGDAKYSLFLTNFTSLFGSENFAL